MMEGPEKTSKAPLADTATTAGANIATKISPVSLRTITGACQPKLNRGTVDWSHGSGLLAYACHSLVVVIDPFSLQQAQVLDGGHRHGVVQVKWSSAPTPKHLADPLTLASADAVGRIVVWNVKSGEIRHILLENGGTSNSKVPVAEMRWLDGQVESCGHLLAAIHSGNAFTLWDTSLGTKVWRVTFSQTLLGFDINPFDPTRVAFKCVDCVLFIDDFSATKEPSSQGRKFYVLGPSRSSPIRSSLEPSSIGSSSLTTTPMREAAEEKGRAARTKIKRIMKELVLGEAPADASGGDTLTLSECLQVAYHRTSRNHLLLVYPREILILDLDIGQTVGVITLERGSPPILQASLSSSRDALFVLHENGTVSLRVRKRLYTVAATPIEPIRSMSKSVSVSSLTNSIGGNSADDVLEIMYEQRAYSESVRLSKNAKILGMALDPATEMSIAVVTSDGRVSMLDLHDASMDVEKKDTAAQPAASCPVMGLEDMIPSSLDVIGAPTNTPLKLLTTGVLSGLSTGPFIIRMCPPLTMKNLNDYVPLMAVGASSGNIQVVNMSTGKLEREFAIHTFPVRGIEWTGLTSLLSHAHQNLSGSIASAAALVRNELVHTDLTTGQSVALRSHRSEEPPIEMLRVSHLKQYFIVAFSNAPFELWDLKSLTLLRTMPKKFPPITALDWSPLHNLKSLKRKHQEQEEANKDHDGDAKDKPLMAKEHFVFTDPEGQLYHFSVEGNAIRDGTKVPAEASLAGITCIAWKSDHIVRGDSNGLLNVWDVRTRTSRNISTHRGAVQKLRFAPGRGNLKLLVLSPDSVAIWDVKECELINELRTPKDMIARVVDMDWAASDRAVLANSEGTIRIMGLSLASASSSMCDYNIDEAIKCHAVLPNKTRHNLHMLLHYQQWKDKYSLRFSSEADGFSHSELELVHAQVERIQCHVREYLEAESTSPLLRCLVASKVCRLRWENLFWRVAAANLLPDWSLDTNVDLCCDLDSYRWYQHERVKLHETRCATHAQRQKVIDLMLCLGLKDESSSLLLETEPDNPHYYEDNLKACLVAATAVSEKDTPHSTMKLVATNLIAEGKLWEGVELFCLINKVPDACKYLQSYAQWDASLWLAKCRLTREEYCPIVDKYCDYAMSKDQKKLAILLRLSLGDHVATLDALLASKMIPLAAQFLGVCTQLKLLPDTSHMMVLSEEICLATARFLFDSGNLAAAFHFCGKADEKGEVLRKEMEILMAQET